MEIAQIRTKHQNNSALRPPGRKLSFTAKRKIVAPKSHPPKTYFPEWHGDASTPQGARRPTPPPAVINDQNSGQQQAEKSSIDISLGKLLELSSQASTPASWCDTEVGDYNDYQQARQRGLFVTPTPAPQATTQGEEQQQGHQQGPNVNSNSTVTASAQARDDQQGLQQGSTPTSSISTGTQGKKPTMTPPLSTKAQGKQPFVAPAVMISEHARPEEYPKLDSNVDRSTPSQVGSDPDTQWAYREAEKVYARQAKEDPTWSDGTIDSPIDVEKFSYLSITNRKRRSPGPEAVTSSSSTTPKKPKVQHQQQPRSHTRRYSAISTKLQAERDQLISSIISNWHNIRLAIPRDLGPRCKDLSSPKKGGDIPAEPQDWSVPILKAALEFSKKTRGEPERARDALWKVATMPGRQYAWLAHAEDLEKAATLLNQGSVQDGSVASGSGVRPLQATDSIQEDLYAPASPPSNGLKSLQATDPIQEEVSAPESSSRPLKAPQATNSTIPSYPVPRSGLETLLSTLCEAAADEAIARRDLRDLQDCCDEDYEASTKALERAKEAGARKMNLKQEIAMYFIAERRA